MRPRSCCSWLVSLSLLFLATGCEETRHVGGQNASPPTAATPAPPPPPQEVSHGEILGKRTQDIRQLPSEEEKKTQVAPSNITARDPITLSGNAYVVAIGQISIGNIKHAIDLYQAENGRYPASYDEFMTKIIKENNIVLPVLPSYQEYFYDEKEHKLQVREYPDRKARAHPG